MTEITTAIDLVDHLTGMADSLDDHVTPEDVHEQLLVARTMAVDLSGQVATVLRDRQATDTSVLRDVVAERTRQDAKWGQQNHDDGTGPETMPLYSPHSNLYDTYPARTLAAIMRGRCARRFESGETRAAREPAGTWTDIFLEEVLEALAEDNPAKLRAELVQSVAVGVAWIEAIDRRTEADRA